MPNEDPGEIERLTLAFTAGHIDRTSTIQRLRELTNDADSAVREEAIRAASVCKLTELEPEIRERLRDEDPIVRLLAIVYFEGLERLAPESIQGLLRSFHDSYEFARTRAMGLLIRIDPWAAVRADITWAEHPISAWRDACELPSPDLEWIAVFSGSEITMCGPCIGTLNVLSAARPPEVPFAIERTGASMIWSSDSRHLAYPLWNADRSQTIGCLDARDRRQGTWPVQGGVFQLTSFASGRLVAQVNPGYEDRELTLELDALVWLA